MTPFSFFQYIRIDHHFYRSQPIFLEWNLASMNKSSFLNDAVNFVTAFILGTISLHGILYFLITDVGDAYGDSFGPTTGFVLMYAILPLATVAVWRYGYSHKLLLKYFDTSHRVFKRCARLERWAFRSVWASFACFSIHIVSWLHFAHPLHRLEYVAYALAVASMVLFATVLGLITGQKTHPSPTKKSGELETPMASVLGNARIEFVLLLVAWVLCASYLGFAFGSAAIEHAETHAKHSHKQTAEHSEIHSNDHCWLHGILPEPDDLRANFQDEQSKLASLSLQHDFIKGPLLHAAIVGPVATTDASTSNIAASGLVDTKRPPKAVLRLLQQLDGGCCGDTASTASNTDAAQVPAALMQLFQQINTTCGTQPGTLESLVSAYAEDAADSTTAPAALLAVLHQLDSTCAAGQGMVDSLVKASTLSAMAPTPPTALILLLEELTLACRADAIITDTETERWQAQLDAYMFEATEQEMLYSWIHNHENKLAILMHEQENMLASDLLEILQDAQVFYVLLLLSLLFFAVMYWLVLNISSKRAEQSESDDDVSPELEFIKLYIMLAVVLFAPLLKPLEVGDIEFNKPLWTVGQGTLESVAAPDDSEKAKDAIDQQQLLEAMERQNQQLINALKKLHPAHPPTEDTEPTDWEEVKESISNIEREIKNSKRK